MSVREAQEKVSSSEFSEWLAYYSIQPFGPRRLDEHNAWQCYWTHVSMCGGNAKPEDFIIGGEDNRAKSVEDKMGLLQSIAHSARR